jgi:lysophospholipase L1-like esterase
MPSDWFHFTARWLTCQSQALVHFAKWRQSKRTIQPNSAPPVPRVSVQDYVANLLEIANLSRTHGAEPVLIAPVYHDAHSNPPEAALISQYRNALRAAAQANTVPYLQIEELTETSYPANDKLFGELIHPNSAGHQLMSKELLKFFTAHGMLPGFKLPENL